MQAKTESFLHLLGRPELLGIAESLQGRNMVAGAGFSMVTKSKSYGAATPWHADPAFCKVRNGINIGIYLDDADQSTGMFWVVPGNHKNTDYDLQERVEQHGFPVPTHAGDLVIHSEDVLHGSPVTHSHKPRRVVYYGVRTIEEQLARGRDLPHLRASLRVLAYAALKRAASPIGKGETPFQHNPTHDECRVIVTPDDYIELRVTGG